MTTTAMSSRDYITTMITASTLGVARCKSSQHGRPRSSSAFWQTAPCTCLQVIISSYISDIPICPLLNVSYISVLMLLRNPLTYFSRISTFIPTSITCHIGKCFFLTTLWWTNILPWKITIFNGKIHETPLFLWPFSIAMLVHQRVFPFEGHVTPPIHGTHCDLPPVFSPGSDNGSGEVGSSQLLEPAEVQWKAKRIRRLRKHAKHTGFFSKRSIYLCIYIYIYINILI